VSHQLAFHDHLLQIINLIGFGATIPIQEMHQKRNLQAELPQSGQPALGWHLLLTP